MLECAVEFSLGRLGFACPECGGDSVLSRKELILGGGGRCCLGEAVAKTGVASGVRSLAKCGWLASLPPPHPTPTARINANTQA